MKSIKKIVALAVLWMACGAVWASLNMYVESNRFWGTENNTVLLVDYQIPYRSLSFVAQHGVFFAELLIEINISQGDSLIFSQELTDNVGIRNRYDAGSNRKTHLGRFSFILSPGLYTMQIKATDLNAEQSFEHTYEITTLDMDEPISDIELNSKVEADSTQYLAQFKRNGILYKSEPSILFSPAEHDFLHLYFEIKSLLEDRTDMAFMSLSVEQDETVLMELFQDFSLSRDVEAITLKIPLAGLNPGKYTGFIDLQVGQKSGERSFEFVVIDDSQRHSFLMPNVDEEAQLMRYFIGNRLPMEWDTMSLEAKRNYITSFWSELAAHMNLTVDQTLQTIRERVDYSNSRFSHFSPGWTSDRGRIYIRNGAPDELEQGESSDETRFVRKDYQIWKYRSRPNAVYLFIDMQMSGNYRLMYVNNDEMENTNPSWMNYLGEDFDLSKLRN